MTPIEQFRHEHPGQWDGDRFRFDTGVSFTSSEYAHILNKWLHSHAINLNNEKHTYNGDLGHGFFNKPTRGFYKHGDPYQNNPIVTFDIETGDDGQIISIAALKSVWDPKAQKLVTVDQYQRFYPTNDKNLVITGGTHGLSAKDLNDLRRKQKAKYAVSYNRAEQEAFKKFIGNSIIAGQNVLDFDIPKTLGFGIQNRVIDTLQAAENIWGRSRRHAKLGGQVVSLGHGLDDIFKRLTGMSMEQAGLKHHDAGSDVVATAIIVEKLLQGSGASGQELRALVQNSGLKYGPMTGIPYVRGDKSSALFMSPSPYGYQTSGMDAYYDAQDFLDKIGLDPVGFVPKEVDFEKSGKELEDVRIMDTSTVEVLNVIKNMLANQQGLGEHYAEFARIQHMNFRSRVLNTLSGVDPDDMEITARGMGFKGDLAPLIQAAKAKQSKSKLDTMYTDLKSMVRSGYGDSDAARSLRNYLSERGEWNGSNIMELDALERFSQEKKYRDLMDNDNISDKQKQYIEQLRAEGASYDELSGKIKQLVQLNQQVGSFITSLSQVRAYDPNQYVDSARRQFSGIMGAASGLVPSRFLGIANSLGKAGFNYVDGKLVPYNRVMGVWNSGIGKAATEGGKTILSYAGLGAGIGSFGGGIGAAPGALIGAGIGIIKAGTQVAGNVAQGRMEQAGYAWQNSLNTANALLQWTVMPLRLLGDAAKKVTGTFKGLLSWTRSLLNVGIGGMQQLGNPLTMLSGNTAVGYQNSGLVDAASVLSKGSTDALYNKIAANRQNLFTFGQYDQNAMMAASMLGVFNEAFMPGVGDATQAGDALINKIYTSLQGKSKSEKERIMNMAGMIDPNIQQIVQTMDVLGVNTVGALKDPTATFGMYWSPIGEDEYKHMRRTQYEWGVAQQGFSNTKMRVADKLWTSFGKNIYNGLNKALDIVVSTGDWKQALSALGTSLNDVKKKFTGLWESLKESGTVDNWKARFKVTIGNLAIDALEIIKKINAGWTVFVTTVWDNMQGVVSWIKGLKIDFDWSKRQFSITTAAERADKAYDKAVQKGQKLMYMTAVQDTSKGGAQSRATKWGYVANTGMQPLIDLARSVGINPETVEVGDLAGLIYNQMMNEHRSISVNGLQLSSSGATSVDDVKAIVEALLGGDNSHVMGVLQQLMRREAFVNAKFGDEYMPYLEFGRKIIGDVSGNAAAGYDSLQNAISKWMAKYEIVLRDTQGHDLATISSDKEPVVNRTNWGNSVIIQNITKMMGSQIRQ